MMGSSGSKSKNWNVGDILGRSKEGFKPLNTEEGDGMLDDDSDSEVKQLEQLDYSRCPSSVAG